MTARRDPRTARRIVRASIAAAAVLIVGAGVLRGLRESARLAAPPSGSASAGPTASADAATIGAGASPSARTGE